MLSSQFCFQGSGRPQVRPKFLGPVGLQTANLRSRRPYANSSICRASGSVLVEELCAALHDGTDAKAKKLETLNSLKQEGKSPKSAEAMRDTFSGSWKVRVSSLPSPKRPDSDAPPGVPLSMLSMGALPNLLAKMHGGYVVTEGDSYTLANIISLASPVASEEHAHLSLEGVQFAMLLMGPRKCDDAPSLEVAFEKTALVPLRDEGGAPRADSLTAVQAVAAHAGLAVDDEGVVLVELNPKPKPAKLEVIYNDGQLHVHEGFMLYVLERTPSAPLHVPLRQAS